MQVSRVRDVSMLSIAGVCVIWGAALVAKTRGSSVIGWSTIVLGLIVAIRGIQLLARNDRARPS